MRIVCLGDEITSAVTPYYNGSDGQTAMNNNWIILLTKNTPDSYINKGISGQTTSQLLSRFDTDVTPNSPDVCIIQGGINDVFTKVDVDTIISNINSMINKCKINKIIPVIIIPIPEWNFSWRFTDGFDKGKYSADQYNFYPEQSGVLPALRSRLNDFSTTGAIICDLYNSKLLTSETTQDTTCYLNDKINPNANGHIIIMDKVASTISLIKHEIVRSTNLSNLQNKLIQELTRRGLSTVNVISPGSGAGNPPKAIYIQEIMDKLSEIKSAPYTENPIIPNKTLIKSIHTQEINAVLGVLMASPKENGTSSCDAACMGLCISCTSCSGCTSCTGTCTAVCGGNCTGGCTSCQGCSGCTHTCAGSCNWFCGFSCNTGCNSACGTSCNSGCGGSCNNGCSTGCNISCTSCTGTCVSGCSNTCWGESSWNPYQ